MSRIPGKRVINRLYIHKSALSSLSSELQRTVRQSLDIAQSKHGTFEYDIVRIGLKDGSVAFTRVHGWDDVPEPMKGVSISVRGGSVTVVDDTSRKLVYHHKWMMVNDDYTGFNVEESKRRSAWWEGHPVVVSLMRDRNERFKSKIGMHDYWMNVLRSMGDTP